MSLGLPLMNAESSFMNQSTEIFESHRPELFRLAYGMLGRITLAEDAVQEAFIRWQKQDIDQINSPKAFLTTIVSRICLDEIKSARNQREGYIGPNLPEPVLTSDVKTPQEEVELAESLSMAMFVVLDELTPIQRAVFILREIFDYDYASISEIINKSESHCRKIAQRARDQINKTKPRFEISTKQQEFVSKFVTYVQQGDVNEIEKMLAKEAILYSDSGGKVTAARKPIYGPNKIARFLVGIQKSAPAEREWKIELRNINAEPGMIIWIDKKLYNAWSFHVEDGKIRSIFVVLNPEKLEHLKHAV